MDPYGWFSSACTCASCQRKTAAFRAEDAEEIAAAALTLKVIRDDGNYTLSGEDGRLGSDPEELALLALLASTFIDKSRKVAQRLREIMDKWGFDAAKITDALTDAQPEMSRVFDDISDEARSLISGAVDAGEAQVLTGVLNGLASRESVIEGIRRACGYYTNGFFNKQVVPSIERMIQDFMSNPLDPLASPDIAPLRLLIDGHFKSVPYWRVVANAAASRGYHWGYLKAAQARSFLGYTLVAVMDERTSDICRELNGRSFWVADALAVMEPAVMSDNPEAVKVAMPWLRAEDIKGLDADGLRALGCLVPPFHGNCRTTIRLF